MGLFDALSDAFKPGSYEIAGKTLACQVCGHQEFHRRDVQLNTAGAQFLGLGWANESAECFVCDNCGYIHWFVTK